MKKIVFVGCEGSGKTTLTKLFSKLYNVPHGIEYGSWYCKNKLKSYLNPDGSFNTNMFDFREIMKGQKQNFIDTLQKAQKLKSEVCFFDTDFIYTKYFINHQYKNWNKIDEFIKEQKIDYFIFLHPQKIYYKKDGIIKTENQKKEQVKLLNLYKKYVKDKLFIVSTKYLGEQPVKVKEIFDQILPHVLHKKL